MPRALRDTAERVLRPDGGEPPDRELCRLARATRLDGPRLPGARASPRGRRDRRPCRGRPVVFLGYWRDEAATAAKVRDGWLHTGDLAEVDDDRNCRSVGRADDLISSGGYRIGPGEIEECLIRHPAVSVAAAIGVPDDVRGEVVKAFVVAVPGADTSPELATELQQHVRTRLAPYEVPREIEFVGELPLTVTGKIRRNELRRLDAARRRG